ncbi:hypothetical protein [Amycolatopsis sp. WAC 04169]|uniref:hypothetical protein n=1 Tax=Amycolatopsis sp. WAC 04169 TaxID=2203197 RepID=UPI000F7A80B0|nr:hypothetical protein [Amycolatopsis sp. WAC 04169]
MAGVTTVEVSDREDYPADLKLGGGRVPHAKEPEDRGLENKVVLQGRSALADLVHLAQTGVSRPSYSKFGKSCD